MTDAPTYVWHSDARSVFHGMGFTCDMAKDTKAFLDHLTLYSYGDVAARADLPKTMWLGPDSTRDEWKLRSLPETFVAGSYFIVSQKTADVLTRFDLGTSALFPIEMLKRGQKEAFDGTYYVVHTSEIKEGFEPDHSENFGKPRHGNKDWLGVVEPTITIDDQIAVNASVREGADLWIDPRLLRSLFFSDALYQALMDADVLGNAETIRCRVI